MDANAYYATGLYTCAQVREGSRDSIAVWDGSSGAIVFANSLDEAQTLLENDMTQQREGENPRELTIRKIVVAPVVDRLLTESGNIPLNWPQILEQAASLVESTAVDDFEQGYWVDINTVVPSDKISFSVGTLESIVPEEVRSGLNWSSNKQFFFLLKVVPLPPPPPIPAYEKEVEGEEAEDAEDEDASLEEPGTGEVDVVKLTLPETVALIQARNSVAAAWLWRRYAANTPWNNNAIEMTPLCATVGEPG